MQNILYVRRIPVFWNVLMCHWVSGSQHIKGSSGTTYPATQCKIPQDRIFSYTNRHCWQSYWFFWSTALTYLATKTITDDANLCKCFHCPSNNASYLKGKILTSVRGKHIAGLHFNINPQFGRGGRTSNIFYFPNDINHKICYHLSSPAMAFII